MSIDVKITQKGLLRKQLSLDQIVAGKLSYGAFDGLRLQPGKIEGNEIIAYDSNHIGRGFSVCWDNKMSKEITLRMLSPTTDEELRAFYDCIQRITDLWNCVLEVDGTVMDPASFLAGFDDMCLFHRRLLADMAQKICDEERGNLTLFSAFWPLVMGKEEAQRFRDEKDGMRAFHDWMHSLQSMDVYYAKPGFYLRDDIITGRYVITEETRSVFPLHGYVPFGMEDPQTNKALQCTTYIMSVYSITENKVLWETEYERFIASISADKQSRYDAENILIEPLSQAELANIANELNV